MSKGYFTAKQVRERYKISAMTLWRWEHDPKIAFPKPLVINRRKLFDIDLMEAWERVRAASPAAA